MACMRKVPFPLDKHHWHPSLIPGPIVLISTYDAARKPNIAPKSWLQMVSFEPPILMFSGTRGNTTENNLLETGCFGVNFVDGSMASRVYQCIQWSGSERIERLGARLVEATQIDAPLVDDCRAHLECRLIETRDIGSGLVVFGEIVAASIWEEILCHDHEKRYELLNQALYLEGSLFSSIDRSPVVRLQGEENG